GNRARWSIAIEHLDDQAASRKIARNFGQCVGGRLGEQTTRRTVTVDRPTDKIVRPCIADIGDQGWNDGPSIEEHCRALRRLLWSDKRGQRGQQSDHPPEFWHRPSTAAFKMNNTHLLCFMTQLYVFSRL